MVCYITGVNYNMNSVVVVVVAENLEYLLTYKVPTLESECAGLFN